MFQGDVVSRVTSFLSSDAATVESGSGLIASGLATWIGVDFGNYKEKHVLGTKIMEFGSTLIEGEGAWLFLIVKIILTALLIFVFSKTRVEYHQKHLRLLIVLALLTVGLAPGLRNLGRNILGV